MTPKNVLAEALKLPPAERIQLVEEIWNSLAVSPETVPVPDWHKAELDRLLDHPEPGPSVSWDEVRDRLRKLK